MEARRIDVQKAAKPMAFAYALVGTESLSSSPGVGPSHGVVVVVVAVAVAVVVVVVFIQSIHYIQIYRLQT